MAFEAAFFYNSDDFFDFSLTIYDNEYIIRKSVPYIDKSAKKQQRTKK